MESLFLALALFLLGNLVAGLVAVARRRRAADAMLAGQLFASTGVAILLLLGAALERPPLRNVALVFTLLAAVATVAFVRRALPGRGPGR